MPKIAAIGVANYAPVLVGDHPADRDAVFAHEGGGEAGSAVEGCGARVATVFAHFDPDGLAVSASFVVGVLALFIGGQALVDRAFIDTKVPSDVAE